MLASAIGAGIAAGLIAALLHFAFVQNIILLGEQYETGAMVHYGGAGSKPAGQSHDEAVVAPATTSDAAAEASEAPAVEPAAESAAEPAAGHDHSQMSGDEPSTFQRNLLTTVFMVIIYVSYGLLLVAGFGIAEAFGRKIGPQEGLLWGLAGFAVFQLAPAMGLAPELPGTIAAELGLRQIWWWMTVACTGTGLALLAYGRHWAAFALAGAFLAVPHVIGAPEALGYFGVAPTELGAIFSARVLGTAMAVWACLGWFAGSAWAHETRSA